MNHIKKIVGLTNGIGKPQIRIVGFILFFLSITNIVSAQSTPKNAEKDNTAEKMTLQQRFGFRSNAVDWLLTVPNVAVEFDLGNTIYCKHSISAGLKYNWRTYHTMAPPQVFNVLDARLEWRQYFRTRRKNAFTEKPDFLTYLKERVLTTQRQNPRMYRAYFWGIYTHVTSYNLKFGKEGKQGRAIGAGLSLGYTAPLYEYANGALDIELGGSIGLIYNSFDAYTHDSESHIYALNPAKSKGGHIVPYPIINDLRVAFVYRFLSVNDKNPKYKYKQTKDGERRFDRKQAIQIANRQRLDKMRFRIDSLHTALSKKGITNIDSLLNKEEQKQWKLMQQERRKEQEVEKEKKLRQQVAVSLGITLSDTLSSKQEKAIREEMQKRKKAEAEAAKQAENPEKVSKKEKKAKKAKEEEKEGEKGQVTEEGQAEEENKDQKAVKEEKKKDKKEKKAKKEKNSKKDKDKKEEPAQSEEPEKKKEGES